MKYLISILLIGVVSCREPSKLTPTIGEMCPTTEVSETETYLRNNLICAEMHKGTFETDMQNWTVVYIVGTETAAAFEKQSDAEAWARSQPYVRQASQVR